MNKIKHICKRLVKNVQAVSPIIATLMLVLVAVGAAGAFYVWQSGWQKDVQGKVSGAGEIMNAMSIGGSTTVYEFADIGASYFEAAHPSYQINVGKGGSGAGIVAVGTGALDIGMSSSDISQTSGVDITKLPDLNQDGVKDIGLSMVQTHMAYDAVVVIANPTTLLAEIDDIGLMAIYYANTGTAVPASHPDAAAITARITLWGGGTIEWTDVPRNLIPNATKCVGGTIKVYDRSDVSGTEETFSKHFLDTGKGTLEDAGIMANHVDSNQVMVTTIAADPLGLGFAAYGVAKQASGLTIPKMLLDGSDMDKDGIKGEAIADVADVTSTTFTTLCKGLYFEGAKKLYFVTVGEPQGAAKVFIDFCLEPDMNAEICKAGGYIGKY